MQEYKITRRDGHTYMNFNGTNYYLYKIDRRWRVSSPRTALGAMKGPYRTQRDAIFAVLTGEVK